MMVKATGKKGVPQGGVISPLLSNLYRNEVDRMLEKAIATPDAENTPMFNTHVLRMTW